jgi:hypothetical protein
MTRTFRDSFYKDGRPAMKRKLNLFLIAVAIGSLCCGANALGQEASSSQGKPPSLEEALNQLKSGLSVAGARLTYSTSYGRVVDARRYQFIGSDGCSLQVLMEVDFTMGGSTSHYKFVETIPLDTIDVGRIRVRRLGSGSDAGLISVKGLNSSEDRDRRAFSVRLSTRAKRETFTYLLEKTYDRTASREHFEGKGSEFGINFIDRLAAEQLATAFRQASQMCQAQERIKPLP